jgi:hypothetical protein
MAGGDLGDEDDGAVIGGPLVAEIASIRSPVRQFLGERPDRTVNSGESRSHADTSSLL